MTKASIIMAAYNHEKFIADAIQSVLDQTHQNFELIIVDDCSTDSTVNMIKQFKDDRIKLTLLPSNQGQFVATNLALTQVTGKYIGILNSDDAYAKDKLTKQINFLNSNLNIAAVFTLAEMMDENTTTKENKLYHSIFNKKNRSRFEWLNYFFNYGNCLCHPSVLIRKEVHDEIGCYDPRFANCADLHLWIRLVSKYEIHIMQEKLTRFRLHTQNKNMSGNSAISQRRMHWEDYQTKLMYFHDLIDERDFLKVFPEAKKFIKKENNKHNINYLLSRVSLETNNTYFNALGLRILFEMMHSNVIVNQLEELYHFTYRDLISLTGQANPFQPNELVSPSFKDLIRYSYHKFRKVFNL